MPSKTQSILLGGAICGVILTLIARIPVVGGCIGCLGYIIAGLVVVWHYTHTHTLTIEGGAGAGMGALGGIVAALVGSVVSVAMISLGLAPGVEEILQELYNAGTLPEEQLEAIADFLNSSLAMVVFVVVGALFGAILGAIGGAIGASVFKKGGEFPA